MKQNNVKMNKDIYEHPGVTVELKKPFLIVKETLERMGVGSKKRKIISPSAYILKKRENYYICHFKNLLELDGKETNFNEEDKKRLHKIVDYLEKWGLVKRIEPKIFSEEELKNVPVLLILYKEKPEYKIIHKYSIGKKKSDSSRII